jgi:hypothetical protein
VPPSQWAVFTGKREEHQIAAILLSWDNDSHPSAVKATFGNTAVTDSKESGLTTAATVPNETNLVITAPLSGNQSVFLQLWRSSNQRSRLSEIRSQCLADRGKAAYSCYGSEKQYA